MWSANLRYRHIWIWLYALFLLCIFSYKPQASGIAARHKNGPAPVKETAATGDVTGDPPKLQPANFTTKSVVLPLSTLRTKAIVEEMKLPLEGTEPTPEPWQSVFSQGYIDRQPQSDKPGKYREVPRAIPPLPIQTTFLFNPADPWQRKPKHSSPLQRVNEFMRLPFHPLRTMAMDQNNDDPSKNVLPPYFPHPVQKEGMMNTRPFTDSNGNPLQPISTSVQNERQMRMRLVKVPSFNAGGTSSLKDKSKTGGDTAIAGASVASSSKADQKLSKDWTYYKLPSFMSLNAHSHHNSGDAEEHHHRKKRRRGKHDRSPSSSSASVAAAPVKDAFRFQSLKSNARHQSQAQAAIGYVNHVPGELTFQSPFQLPDAGKANWNVGSVTPVAPVPVTYRDAKPFDNTIDLDLKSQTYAYDNVGNIRYPGTDASALLGDARLPYSLENGTQPDEKSEDYIARKRPNMRKVHRHRHPKGTVEYEGLQPRMNLNVMFPSPAVHSRREIRVGKKEDFPKFYEEEAGEDVEDDEDSTGAASFLQERSKSTRLLHTNLFYTPPAHANTKHKYRDHEDGDSGLNLIDDHDVYDPENEENAAPSHHRRRRRQQHHHRKRKARSQSQSLTPIFLETHTSISKVKANATFMSNSTTSTPLPSPSSSPSKSHHNNTIAKLIQRKQQQQHSSKHSSKLTSTPSPRKHNGHHRHRRRHHNHHLSRFSMGRERVHEDDMNGQKLLADLAMIGTGAHAGATVSHSDSKEDNASTFPPSSPSSSLAATVPSSSSSQSFPSPTQRSSFLSLSSSAGPALTSSQTEGTDATSISGGSHDVTDANRAVGRAVNADQAERDGASADGPLMKDSLGYLLGYTDAPITTLLETNAEENASVRDAIITPSIINHMKNGIGNEDNSGAMSGAMSDKRGTVQVSDEKRDSNVHTNSNGNTLASGTFKHNIAAEAGADTSDADALHSESRRKQRVSALMSSLLELLNTRVNQRGIPQAESETTVETRTETGESAVEKEGEKEGAKEEAQTMYGGQADATVGVNARREELKEKNSVQEQISLSLAHSPSSPPAPTSTRWSFIERHTSTGQTLAQAQTQSRTQTQTHTQTQTQTHVRAQHQHQHQNENENENRKHTEAVIESQVRAKNSAQVQNASTGNERGSDDHSNGNKERSSQLGGREQGHSGGEAEGKTGDRDRKQRKAKSSTGKAWWTTPAGIRQNAENGMRLKQASPLGAEYKETALKHRDADTVGYGLKLEQRMQVSQAGSPLPTGGKLPTTIFGSGHHKPISASEYLELSPSEPAAPSSQSSPAPSSFLDVKDTKHTPPQYTHAETQADDHRLHTLPSFSLLQRKPSQSRQSRPSQQSQQSQHQQHQQPKGRSTRVLPKANTLKGVWDGSSIDTGSNGHGLGLKQKNLAYGVSFTDVLNSPATQRDMNHVGIRREPLSELMMRNPPRPLSPALSTVNGNGGMNTGRGLYTLAGSVAGLGVRTGMAGRVGAGMNGQQLQSLLGQDVNKDPNHMEINIATDLDPRVLGPKNTFILPSPRKSDVFLTQPPANTMVPSGFHSPFPSPAPYDRPLIANAIPGRAQPLNPLPPMSTLSSPLAMQEVPNMGVNPRLDMYNLQQQQQQQQQQLQQQRQIPTQLRMQPQYQQQQPVMQQRASGLPLSASIPSMQTIQSLIQQQRQQQRLAQGHRQGSSVGPTIIVLNGNGSDDGTGYSKNSHSNRRQSQYHGNQRGHNNDGDEDSNNGVVEGDDDVYSDNQPVPLVMA